jgi:hypothetical protein
MSPAQIRGLLLEEAVLHLLRSAGYSPIYGRGADDTLEQEGDALFVKGRGERHQIDAIADYRIQPPFSNPQRLLVEAKFYDRQRVGLAVIRNAVGVLSDVSQFFIAPRTGSACKLRFHYQYAVVSATRFSDRSQRYAYAHDVFLIPLGESMFFQELLDTIRDVAEGLSASSIENDDDGFAGKLRGMIREGLRYGDFGQQVDQVQRIDRNEASLDNFVQSCLNMGFCLLAVTAGGFPLFLVPVRGLRLQELEDRIDVRIYRGDSGWTLETPQRRLLFTFDVPIELMSLYSGSGELTPERALNMKEQEMHEIKAVVTDGQSLRVIRFILDVSWITAIRRD